MTEYNEIAATYKKWQYEIRGLYEVATDERGITLIGKAILAMQELQSAMEDTIARLEEDNMALMLALRNDEGLRREHAIMKQALKTTVKLDEIEKEIRQRIDARDEHQADTGRPEVPGWLSGVEKDGGDGAEVF